MVIFERDIAVDMGTSSTLLFEQGKGIVAREPTVVAVNRITGKISKVGQDAQKLIGRTPADIVAIHPVSAGVISDYEMAAQMLRELVSRVTSFSLFKPCVLACVSSSVTGVEERAMIDAAIEAGARKVYLLETSVATAMGAGVDISRPEGHMVIDIGGGTTEIAIISAGGVVECESIKIAGASFDEAIVKYVRRKHDMLIGIGAAEEIKRSIGCVMQRSDMGVEEVKGRSLVNGMPKVVHINANELIEAFVEPMNAILEAIHTVLERTPPQLVGDLDTNGIIMSGGGCLIYGMDRLIERSTGIRTTVVDDPISCTAYGAGKMLKHLEDMEDGMRNFFRMRQLKN
ncbi:MAG: rod shape-determining protein [Oscillospiraceae bacterium]|nr:rod shape-determining protein [Oscillospiraceae bacterium]